MDVYTHSFTFRSFDFEKATGILRLSYQIGDTNILTEKVHFDVSSVDWSNVNEDALHRAAFALHLIGGISYWKTYCPRDIRIESGTLTKDQAEFWNKLYTRGLGEFFYQNQIDFRDLIQFPYEEDYVTPEALELDLPEKAFLPIGGGKDSLASASLLMEAGMPFTTFALYDHGPIKACMDLLGNPRVVVGRTIDPQLFELNKKEGVFNGHIPITAYINFILLFSGILYGHKYGVWSLEKSADYGQLEYLGMEINHQYSKSYEFEEDFAGYVGKYITTSYRAFSILRPFYELKIAKIFSDFVVREKEQGRDFLSIMTSCNRSFKVHLEKSKTLWCGECPKCAFVFSMLAAFLPKELLVKTFGKNLYADEKLIHLFRELLGVEKVKPFECVGTPQETQLAFIYAQLEYDEDVVMKDFINLVLPKILTKDRLEELSMNTNITQLIPEKFRNIFSKY